MIETNPSIYFYIPTKHQHGGLPETIDDYWNWQISLADKWNWGRYFWTLQTYLYLKSINHPCQLVDILPQEGICLAHRDYFSTSLQPNHKLLMICLQADRTAHPYAQLHVVQNPKDKKLQSKSKLWQSAYLPHWIQPNLIPRDSNRGDRIKNLAFVGNERNIAPELKSSEWTEKLKTLGLTWRIVERDRWNDYKDIDLVIAIRNFSKKDFSHKPALKLHNAWNAGVPLILGVEYAYQAKRKSDLDYIEVQSLDELFAAIKKLCNNPHLYRDMIHNGQIRAQETAPENMIVLWKNFLEEMAIPAYKNWVNAAPIQRNWFLLRRELDYRVNNLHKRFGEPQ